MIYIQPLTGADLKPVQKLEVKVVQAALAPLATKNHAQIVVAMDAQQAHISQKSSIQSLFLRKYARALTFLVFGNVCQGVHVFPDTDETRQLVAAKSGSIFFYLTEVGSSVMKGYVMVARKQCKELFKGGWCLKAEEAWTVVLPKSEAITAHILKSPLNGDRTEKIFHDTDF